jgi:hypothetical protein
MKEVYRIVSKMCIALKQLQKGQKDPVISTS